MILLASCLYRAVHPFFAASLWKVARESVEDHVLMVVENTELRMACQAVLEKARELRPEGIVWAEQDMAFEPADFDALVSMARERAPCILGAFYPHRKDARTIVGKPLHASPQGVPADLDFAAMAAVRDAEPVEAEHVGFGFCWTSPEILEALGPPYFGAVWRPAGSDRAAPGGYIGGDVGICLRAREAGYPVYGVCLRGVGHEFTPGIRTMDVFGPDGRLRESR